MAIEISITKDFEEKLKLSLDKTPNTEPDILHWYAKVLIFDRKRYILATNTLTRFALFFRFNSKTLKEDFMKALMREFAKYNLNFAGLMTEEIILSLGNSRLATAQLNTTGFELSYLLQYRKPPEFNEDYTELFGNYNEGNLGKAGNSSKMVFALEEMRMYY